MITRARFLRVMIRNHPILYDRDETDNMRDFKLPDELINQFYNEYNGADSHIKMIMIMDYFLYHPERVIFACL